MSKKPVKQSTLFQSWKNSQTKNESKWASTGQTDIEVLDVDDMDDIDDQMLDYAFEKSLQQIESNKCEETKSGSVAGVQIVTPSTSSVKTIPGFDISSGDLWIYPTNYPVRDYQFNIVQSSLFKNTLVTLPTGLGKTFIAAVLMFNFYRWYPRGKVIFLAPTKPLVAQQIEACYKVMGLPQNDTAEMTGSVHPPERKAMWEKCRVFFLTPQIMTNDMLRGICPTELVKCVVFDEAHKALGNHAYCQVVQELLSAKSEFRVLALSATPGTDIKSVQQVIDNLCIAHVEIRSEESIDIQQYTHQREIKKIVVQLGEDLLILRDTYVGIMSFYVNRLINRKAIPKQDPRSLSKFILLKAREAFRQDPPASLPYNQLGSVEGDFALCMSLYHAYELLQLHGTRSFYNFLQGLIDGQKGSTRGASVLSRNEEFTEMMSDLKAQYGNEAFNQSLWQRPQSAEENVDKDKFVISHPKMAKLTELLEEFFTQCKNDGLDSRCMVFSQYRDSVIEITEMLNKVKPLVKAMSFVGQKMKVGKNGKGITQKEQLRVVKEFKTGGYNTLVCTCVGEEGLDIGEVDLIVCYDSPTSPIRLVQRMGRTGRQRKGKIIALVTEGKEEQMYNKSVCSKKSIHKALVNGTKLRMNFKSNPRMVPIGMTPTCLKLHMTMPTYQTRTSSSRGHSKQYDVPSCLTHFRKNKKDGPFLTDKELQRWNKFFKLENERFTIPEPKLVCLTNRDAELNQLNKWHKPESLICDRSFKRHQLSLSDWLPWQNLLQPHDRVSHSDKTKLLVDSLKFIDLQSNVPADEDPFGMEMSLYLNKDDVVEEDFDDIFNQAADDQESIDNFNDFQHLNVNHGVSYVELSPKLDFMPQQKPHNIAEENSDDDLPLYDCLNSAIPNCGMTELNSAPLESLPLKDHTHTLVKNHTVNRIVSNDFNVIRSPPSSDEMLDESRESLSPVDLDCIINNSLKSRRLLEEDQNDNRSQQFDDIANVKYVPKEEITNNYQSFTQTNPVTIEMKNNETDLKNADYEDPFCDGQENFLQNIDLSKITSEYLHRSSSSDISNHSFPDERSNTLKAPPISANISFKLNTSGSCSMTQLLALADVETQELMSAAKQVVPKKDPTSKSPDNVDYFIPPSPVAVSKLEKMRNRSQVLKKSEKPAIKIPVHSRCVTESEAKDPLSRHNVFVNSCKIDEDFEAKPAGKPSFSAEVPFVSADREGIKSASGKSSWESPAGEFTSNSHVFPEKIKHLGVEEEFLLDDADDDILYLAENDPVIQKSTERLFENKASAKKNVTIEPFTSKAPTCDKAFDGFSSDDDFLTSFHLSKINPAMRSTSLGQSDDDPVIKKRRIRCLETSSSDESNFVVPVKKSRKAEEKICQFIVKEAELSNNDESCISEDEIDDSQLDEFESSFINDETCVQHDSKKGCDAGMQAVYLQSIRSPKQGKFKLQFNPTNELEIYSQIVEEDDDSYERDSFCVDNSDFDGSTQFSDEEKKECLPSRAKVCHKNETKTSKRRRIITMSESSEEENFIKTPTFGFDPDLAASDIHERKIHTEPKTSHQHLISPPNLLSENLTVKGKADRLKVQKTGQGSHFKKDDSSLGFDHVGVDGNLISTGGKAKVPHESPLTFGKVNNSKTSKALAADPRFSSPNQSSITDIQRNNLLIIVDSRETIASHQIISSLKSKYAVKIVNHKLACSGYILSNRAAVERQTYSEFCNTSNKKKLIDQVRHMCELFDRPYIVVEKNRLKNGEQKNKSKRSKYLNSMLSYFAQTHIKVLYSESQENSAYLFYSIALQEFRKGMNIKVLVELSSSQEKLCSLYQSLPRISYISALNLAHGFPSFKDLSNSSVDQLKLKCGLSHSRAEELSKYLKKTFNPDMPPS